MSRSSQAFALTLLIALLPGCSTDYGSPYVDEGPLPLSGPGITLVRYQQTKRHPKLGRVDRTLWSDGGAPTDPLDFINPLRAAIPEDIHEKLRRTTPVRYADGRAFDQPDYSAHGNLVCLNPDVLVLTLRRSIADEKFQHPFGDFTPWSHAAPARSKMLEETIELIHCDGPQLCFFAGRLLPYSDEMYLVSTDPEIASRKLVFDNNECVIETQAYSFRLLKSGTDVVVTEN